MEVFGEAGGSGGNSQIHARDTGAAKADAQAIRLPLQDWSRSIDYHDFTLIWPICSVIHQSSSNRILPYVTPLLRVTFAAPEYVIKESRLPEPLLHHGHRHRSL